MINTITLWHLVGAIFLHVLIMSDKTQKDTEKVPKKVNDCRIVENVNDCRIILKLLNYKYIMEYNVTYIGF